MAKLQAGTALAICLALAACASAPSHKDPERRIAARCPAGHTMACEAKKIGRIFHGTFSKNTDKCACVPDNGRTLDSPVIPTIRQ